jgi:hypothetical protein
MAFTTFTYGSFTHGRSHSYGGSFKKYTVLRGRKLVFPSPIAADKVNPRRPFTRSTCNKNIPMKDDAAKTSAQRKGKSKYPEQTTEIIDITTS